jgi:hypothetical protein
MAVPLKVELCLGHAEALFSLQSTYQLLYERILELDNLSANAADEMLVLDWLPYLIIMAGLPETPLFNQAQFLEKAQAPVNGCQADGFVGAAGAPVQLLGIDMPAGITN